MKIDFPNEKFIEDYVYEKSRDDGQCILSGDAVDRIWRQLAIPGYGVTDIVKAWFTPSAIELTVLELKNEPLKESHLSQLMRYMKGLRRMVASCERGDVEVTVCGQLAGPFDPDRGDFVYMLGFIPREVSAFGLALDMEIGFSSEALHGDWSPSGADDDWGLDRMQDLHAAHRQHIDEWRSRKDKVDAKGQDLRLVGFE